MSIKKVLLIALGLLLSLFAIFFLAQGSVVIKSDQEVNISINDKVYENKTIFTKRLNPGEHTIKISKDGYIEYEEKIEIENWARKEIQVSLNLSPIFKKLSEKKVFNPFLSANKILALSKNRSSIYVYNIDTEEEKIIDLNIPYISGASWSPDGEKVIIAANDFENPNNEIEALEDEATSVWYFNLETKEKRKLSPYIEGFAWSNNGEGIFYSKFSGGDFSIYFSSPNGEGEKLIKKISVDRPFLISSKANKLSLYPEIDITTYSENNIYVLHPDTKEFKQITDDGRSTGAIWSPDNNNILYTTLSDKAPSLNMMTIEGKNKRSLNVETVSGLINKTAFSKDGSHLYAAIPESKPANYLSNETITRDQLWKINLNNDTRYKLSATNLDIENMMISDDEKHIYFVSPTDHNIYSIRIEE